MTIEFCLSGNNLPVLYEQLQKLDPSQRWKVEVRRWKSKRSQEQNARYWAFITGFGKYLGYTKEEMHDLCRYKFLFDVVEINGNKMRKLRSTPKESTAEFAEYSEHCERWASELGYYFE